MDIIYSFIEYPHIMIYRNRLRYINNKNYIIINSIYNLFLKDYNIILDNYDLKQPLYIQLKDEYTKIMIVLQKIKLDNCINTFSNQ